MIEINLLPKQQRAKKKEIEIPKIKFMPVIIGAVILIISVQLILSLTLIIKKYRLKSLKVRWTVIEPQKEKGLATRKEINALDKKIKNIEALKRDRILWARKLNEISDSVMPNVWLTHLSVEEKEGKKYLSIKGNVHSFGRDEAAIVGRFMKALKENKSFFEDFNEIKLATMQQEKVQDVDVMSFSISCYFKD